MDEAGRNLDDRKSRILRALVLHYVQTGEPVGSKTLVQRFRLDVSPATVRNEMAALEDAGYIYQPHTSAGRVPTDAGYRYFVDAYARDVRLPAADADVVRRFFGEPRWELEESLRHTATLLSRITQSAAVVFAPALQRSTVRHIEVVGLTGSRAMVVVVNDSGRVENHVVQIPQWMDDGHLERAARLMNRLCAGSSREHATTKIRAGLETVPGELRPVVDLVMHVLDEQLRAEDERIFLEGTSNILDEQKFADIEIVREVVGALEHRRLLLEILADALSSERVSVRIGSENLVAGMKHCSVITTSYSGHGTPLGTLGIVGPTRMDYRRSIAAVYEVASNLGRMLSEFGM